MHGHMNVKLGKYIYSTLLGLGFEKCFSCQAQISRHCADRFLRKGNNPILETYVVTSFLHQT